MKYVELGWIVSDQAGSQYMAGSLPSSEAGLYLPPGQKARVLQESTLNFSSNGQPVNVRKMTGSSTRWSSPTGKSGFRIGRTSDDPLLQKVIAPSAEEQRLSSLYRRKGIEALVEELKKY